MSEDQLRAEVKHLREALAEIAEQQPETLRVLKANGIVFSTALDKPDSERTEAERWEKVAFTIYTDLCHVDWDARNALAWTPDDGT